MNRLANALLFAVVVMTAFVLEVRSSPPQYSPARVLARVIQRVTPAAPPVYLGSWPGMDQAEMERVFARTEAARAVLTRVEMRQMERHARMEAGIAKATCKVVRLDQ